jgi:16S rRNA processing protein RimM
MSGAGGRDTARPAEVACVRGEMRGPLVTMGRILGAWGVQGWVKIAPFSASPSALCSYPKWWIGGGNDWRQVSVEASEAHANSVVAKLSGYDVRETVAGLKGCEVAVPRAELPAAAEGEIYWADLVGLDVVNLQGEALGRVSEVFSNGAHEVLRIAQPGRKEDRLLPYVDAVVREVSEEARRIVVDWGADW